VSSAGASLEEQARAFAEDLTATVRALVPDCDGFDASLLNDRPGRRERFWVRQDPASGIPLSVGGDSILTLKVDYHCCLDGVERWLAVDEALVKVYAGPRAEREPLLRYHYRREGADDVAAAHLHVHAHRDAFSHVLGKAGAKTKRGKRRSQSDGIPAIADLHFPLGGHRFRPCLEDVLEFLVIEFGVDHPEGALAALQEGRIEWRRRQTRTVVRDDPDDAVAALRSLGYEVNPPPGSESKVRRDRLAAI
jgi:hypothetical protein